MKHFKLRLDLKKEFLGKTLFRIEAIIDSKWAKKGDLGGYVEKESNVSDNAWVYGDAWVSGDALVYGNAQVYGNALVSGNAQVYGNALVYGNARVYGDARVSGDARVYGDAWVSGDAKVEKYGQCIVINNLKNTITVMPNLITIGCKSWKTLAEFETSYKAIGANYRYNELEAEQSADFVRAAMRLMSPIKQTIKITHEGKDFEIDLEKAKELGLIK